jgi:hypothetical protein
MLALKQLKIKQNQNMIRRASPAESYFGSSERLDGAARSAANSWFLICDRKGVAVISPLPFCV